MNTKPNDIVALEWLVSPVNELLDGLHLAWRDSNKTQYGEFAEQFRVLGNVMIMANLPLFAQLAYTISQGCLTIFNDELAFDENGKLLYASRLLQHEFGRYVGAGTDYHLVLGLRVHYLKQLLEGDTGDNANKFSEKMPVLTGDDNLFDEDVYQKLALAWQKESETLLTKNDNDPTTLANLAKALNYLQQGTNDRTLQSLWLVAGLWLGSLAKNGTPKPAEYADLLAELGRAIGVQQTDSYHDKEVALGLENTLVDIYAQLGELASVSDEAKNLLSILSDSTAAEQAFFPRVLGMLEGVLYAFANGDVQLNVLEDIKSRLGKRGWSFYENYTAQIIDDVKAAQSDTTLFSQMQWQLNTQLQDLYAGILSTHEAIENKVGESIAMHASLESKLGDTANKQAPDQIRRVRILVEDLKFAFADYLHSKDIEQLPEQAIFVELDQTFGEMGMYDIVGVVERIGELVLILNETAPEKLSWQFADAMTDGLSLLELFLDGLAKQVFDNQMLARAKQSVEKALAELGNDGDEFDDTAVVDNSVVRYDDTGEIGGADADEAFDGLIGESEEELAQSAALAKSLDKSSEKTEQIAPQAEAPQETEQLSEAYLEVKNSLLADNFDFDADIREIFVEEAADVIAELNDLLPAWQRDVSNLTALKDIRRGFHTLKGSGRMVGAFSVGETAWSIENMLNRVLDNTIKPTNPMASFLIDITTKIPTLVKDFENNQPPSIDPAILIVKANNLLAGKPLDEGLPQGICTLPSAKQTTAEPAEQAPTAAQEAGGGVDNADAWDLPEVLKPFMEEALQPVTPTVDVDSVDDDIREIFIEEAGEVLENIVPLFETWRVKASDKNQLTDIRRGFHTLKGSGRMVAAVELGELAWSIENMLNRVLDNTIAINDGILALMGDVLGEFGNLVQIFASGSDDYPAKIKLWQAVAHAYSKGHGESFDYRNLGGATSAKQAVDLNQIQDAEDEAVVDEQHDKKSKSSTDALLAIEEASAIMKGANFGQVMSDEEAELCALFVEEAKELLGGVKEFLAENAYKDTVAIPDGVVRIFHTLRGASGLAPLADIGKVGATIEKGLQGLQQHEAMMNVRHLKALGSAVKVIEHHLMAYESEVLGIEHTEVAELPSESENEQMLAELLTKDGKSIGQLEISELITGVETLLDADLELEDMAAEEPDLIKLYAETMLAEIEVLESRTLVSSKFQRLLHSLSSAYQVIANHTEQLKDDSVLDALLAAHGQLTSLLDSVAGSMALSLDEKVANHLDNKISEIQGYYTAIDRHDLVVATADDLAKQANEPVGSAVEYQAIETDPDLLEIFLEEATELDTAIGEAFGQWRDNPSDTEALKVLQRHLHTVKGGARLAGITSVGDLTHEAETAYEQMVDGRLAPTAGWVRIMQGVQDILSLQLEEIRTNKRSFFATGAVEELQAYIAAKEVADTASITMPALGDNVAQETQAVQATETSEDEPESDFIRMQQRSWQGNFPDADILRVFLEESEGLVASSSEDFQAFRSNTGDIATLQTLQHKLHTIKGGARMVGAAGVADLAHQMEAVYEDLAQRRRPATRMVTQLLLSCHDWLGQAIQLLKAVYNPPKPMALIDALEEFSRRPDSLTEVPVVSLVEELNAVVAHEEFEKQRRGGHDISRMPSMKGFVVQADDNNANNEMIRISANMVERMINLSGEAAINRARIDMNITSLMLSIEEMGATVQRLADQLRRMDIELEAQILAQLDDQTLYEYEGFDPLEMDQYSSLNQLSKSLSESASDLLDLKATMLDKTRDGENLLLQLSRTQTELQDSLMHSRMVPFSRLTPRLQRIVRQVSGELGKSVELSVVTLDDEMDRTILERITSPLEHMLRNAIDHGIEMPDDREAAGKNRTGKVVLEVVREGNEILVHLTDDGAGINVDAVRKKAVKQGLISADDDTLSDLDIMQYIFNAGFSTASVVTQISGRGVGMDVVRSEIRQLGGSVAVDSTRGQGSRFTMRVPLTVAVSDTLVVRAADRQYAIPLVQIERVVQADPKELLAYYRSTRAYFHLEGEGYRLRYLNEILTGHHFSELLSTNTTVPVIIIKNQTGQNLALQVDEIIGSRVEVVVKPLGRQLSNVAGISSATIMGDGSVMFILDLMALIRNAQVRVAVPVEEVMVAKRPTVLVVDDSVTVRKVTSRFLERQGYEAVVAKDGVDAMEILQELTPDLMLLDIEMPRMDGFEVATQVRHNTRLKELPIIMITSRTGEKHRERALEIGVNDYMGKPFQEIDLLNRIQALLAVKS